MILLAGIAALATGCVYRMNIQQGNFMAPDSVAQLKQGMTRSQVRFLLGTPMVPVAFNDDRWDYFFYLRAQRLGKPWQRHLTVYFESDKVTRFEDDGQLVGAEAVEAMEKGVTKAPKVQKESAIKRIFGDDEKPADQKTEEQKKQDQKDRPDPVPASDPAPAPAGTPSGQQ
jgi:outer membrane protein assembly factor BamE